MAQRLAGEPTPGERHAAEALREEMATISTPLRPCQPGTAEEAWLRFRTALRSDALTKDCRFFLNWPVIKRTMFVSPRRKSVRMLELPALREAGWLPYLSEDFIGTPMLITGLPTSTNLIHHAYHLLRFEQATGKSISEYPRVFEFGGGYGSMCRLVHRLTFGSSTVTILDLPEFTALQRYYLGLLSIPAILVSSAGELDPAAPADLFIATWSVSEVPVADRRLVLEYASLSRAFLIAFQDQFGEINNVEFFQDWIETVEGVVWTMEETGHRKGNYYLFGARE